MATVEIGPSQPTLVPNQIGPTRPRRQRGGRQSQQNTINTPFPQDRDGLTTDDTPAVRQGTSHREAPPARVSGASQRTRGQRNSRESGINRGRGGRPAINTSTAPSQPTDNPGNTQRGRRGHGGYGRNTENRSLMRQTPGRQFGGRLTSTVTETETAPSTEVSNLDPGAPEFRPGQQHQHRKHGSLGSVTVPPLPVTTPRRRRESKSNAPDLPTRIHEDIANGVYECQICTNEVARNSKIWSCRTCWAAFHLGCIMRWSRNESSTQAQQQAQGDDQTPARQWRCPGCNLPKDTLPGAYSYSCWCEKESFPPQTSGIPPHSCGQTCARSRLQPKRCPHPCELVCHAGPCPPCAHLGPVQRCFCGKKTSSRRCTDTDYDNGWSCGEICGDLMPCGIHYCERPCHEGLCGACEVQVDARCYCGKVTKPLICCEVGEEKKSQKVSKDDSGEGAVDEWSGTFNCGGTCTRVFDCGQHFCEKQCHTQDPDPPHCPLSPDMVSTCPCAKTPLDEILTLPRQSCGDIIPSCEKICSKLLPCGHVCLATCHSGACSPCLQKINISCRCGRTTNLTVCHQGNEEKPQCRRVCHVTRNCGRHECGERCCLGEKRDLERQAKQRKMHALRAAHRLDSFIEAEHICTKTCDRLLKCGNHQCQELCHRGPCGSCREAVFDEISCHCGRTVLQPPVPCGTAPPPCRYQCERPKTCGHPQIQHTCHQDDEACPKCPYLVEKACMCGKKTLKNQPCRLADASCGETCGKKLRCGSHFCRLSCHKPGHCEDAGKTCQQLCGKAKKSCGDPCEEICHAPAACREDKPCQSKILITCDCQHLKQEARCSASKTSEGNTKKTLKCDDECARLERNRKLALALNIDPETHKDDHIPYSAATLEMYRGFPKWAQTQEREFRVFAADDTEKRLRFKPMPGHQRAFIHSLAEDFGFDSESMDPEPHRHVFVFKTPRFVASPMKTLGECISIKALTSTETTNAVPASSTTRTSTALFNGFLLKGPRFALTIEELRTDLAPAFATDPKLSFEIAFLPSEDVVISAKPTPNNSFSPLALENAVKSLKTALSSIILTKKLASETRLCALDASKNVLRREEDVSEGGGWSKVAAKAAAPRQARAMPGVGSKSAFTVLGSRVKEKKEKEKERKEEVVEDWEEEVRIEEENEKKRRGDVEGVGEQMKEESNGEQEGESGVSQVLGEKEEGNDSKTPDGGLVSNQ